MMVVEFDNLSFASNADRLPIDQTQQRHWQAHVKRHIPLTQRDDGQPRLRQGLNCRPKFECRHEGARDKHTVASGAALPKAIESRGIESMVMCDVTPGPQ